VDAVLADLGLVLQHAALLGGGSRCRADAGAADGAGAAPVALEEGGATPSTPLPLPPPPPAAPLPCAHRCLRSEGSLTTFLAGQGVVVRTAPNSRTRQESRDPHCDRQHKQQQQQQQALHAVPAEQVVVVRTAPNSCTRQESKDPHCNQPYKQQQQQAPRAASAGEGVVVRTAPNDPPLRPPRPAAAGATHLVRWGEGGGAGHPRQVRPHGGEQGGGEGGGRAQEGGALGDHDQRGIQRPAADMGRE